ncbi:carboxypeptidase-like regulatory domain-containing protein [Tenacibaculum tangerinum]|uniref:Carboxypeptidase-like regulatory domain-containing protein n=1 Tax=Tenacibaculum tangerinum TaxID=3038772 RepID=A0ABY8L411_9FLAO|nr:carboxypeptidase-like regulatory domain-containing protein [Tenacibaculum tangerinum]WGH75826.1 carboxypeptidase-like regulatory domain-containing protein [Tenacibaculum tangerinum]
MRVFLLFCFISTTIFSQTVVLKNTVIDWHTNEPVAYANISFLNENVGVSSDENGVFSLQINKQLLHSKVHISCLNYKDTIVLASTLQSKPLKLQPKLYELEEVVISKKADRELVVDKYKRRDIRSGFSGRKGSPWTVAKYFPYKNEYESVPFLKSITVYFTSLMLRKKARFRIRLFKIDENTGEPSEDMLKEDLIVDVKKTNGKVEVDVSKLDIVFPQEGFFIGLERLHIPYNFHERTYTRNGSREKYKDTIVAPSFGAVFTKDTIFIKNRGKWRKHYFPQEFYKGNALKPAISVTLSN